MSARQFMDQLQQVKTAVKSGEASPQVAEGLGRLGELVKRLHSPEELKAAVHAGSDVSTDLEEAMTTLFMMFVQQRGRG